MTTGPRERADASVRAPLAQHAPGRRRCDDPAPIAIGSLWMIAISLALFWLPALGALLGGLVGGYKVGAVRRAIVAAVLPIIVVSATLWILLLYVGLPMIGETWNLGIGDAILFADIGIFVGAIVGGAMPHSYRRPPHVRPGELHTAR